MNDFERHVFTRLDSLEAELYDLREATWPVCQGMIDARTGPFSNLKEKRKFLRFLHVEDIKRLLKRKAWFMGTDQGLVDEEVRLMKDK